MFLRESKIMPKIEIYTTTTCPYCVRAKQLLTSKNVAFTEISLNTNPELKDVMITKAGGRKTVPQIFINDQHIGGCDDLYALESEGKLAKLLA